MPLPVSTAGTRNRRIKFQQRTPGAADGYGNTVGAWEDICGPFWARVRPIVGREEILAQRMQGVTPFEITVLKNSQTVLINAGCRAVDVRSGDTFDILEDPRNPDERDIDLAFMVKKGLADG